MRIYIPFSKNFIKKTQENVPVDMIMEECCALFAKILMRLQDKVEKRNGSSDEAQALKDFIEQNIHRELTVKDMASAIFRSPDYVNKLFKRCYGTTPYSYYIELRIANAEALLRHTALSVSEISERLGYKSSQYFSKQFKHVKGVTASAFRHAEKNM